MELPTSEVNCEASAARFRLNVRQRCTASIALSLCIALATVARASDHLDSPATVANPEADIADVYAWTSPEGRQLDLVMTILGHTFSNKLQYVLHVDSGRSFGHTSASTNIVCHFSAANSVTCKVGNADEASGDPTNPTGLEGRNHRFRVYAALRDDPFYNNVKGLLGAYQTANTAIKNGAVVDAAGCAHYDQATTKAILDQMSHTDGGPAQNLLYNWTVSAIVISVDLNAVTKGGKILAVWGTTSQGGKQIDRMARPFVGNTLLGGAPFSTDDASGVLRQEYNEAPRATWGRFVADLEKTLAFEDSLDGKCGNQLLAGPEDTPARYRALARVFADDRLWVNSASTVCTQFFAVELASLAGQKTLTHDCGGRTPTYDTSNVWRSLLIAGTITGITDGLHQDEHPPSATVFPFLAPPDPHGVNH
ncbi:MAG: hypothetical protein JO361_05355 [Gammaproteobacteria bacterium]|nr:hypothetical protein [Gammaproteobacteria bacterium]